MKYVYVILVGMLSFTSSQALASGYNTNNPRGGLGTYGAKEKAGIFCLVKNVNVCVIARDIKDCERIGGEKVKTCSKPE